MFDTLPTWFVVVVFVAITACVVITWLWASNVGYDIGYEDATYDHEEKCSGKNTGIEFFAKHLIDNKYLTVDQLQQLHDENIITLEIVDD